MIYEMNILIFCISNILFRHFLLLTHLIATVDRINLMPLKRLQSHGRLAAHKPRPSCIELCLKKTHLSRILASMNLELPCSQTLILSADAVTSELRGVMSPESILYSLVVS